MNKKVQKHPFHLVTPSPWPLFASVAALLITLGGVMYMHRFFLGGFFLLLGIVYLLGIVGLWWRDVIREATFEGMHTSRVQQGLKFGMVLFIISEVMFFFAFFWAFFHSSLAPGIEIGSIWPPVGIEVFDPWGIPLLNTFILLLSGATITYTHHALVVGSSLYVVDGFLYTILLAILFTLFQLYEYKHASFSINDGVYGSTFFMATGFHGLHVLIGTAFISVCFARYTHFTTQHHLGFEAAAWYWHFVDVVWLFLFVTIYWWGSL